MAVQRGSRTARPIEADAIIGGDRTHDGMDLDESVDRNSLAARGTACILDLVSTAAREGMPLSQRAVELHPEVTMRLHLKIAMKHVGAPSRVSDVASVESDEEWTWCYVDEAFLVAE